MVSIRKAITNDFEIIYPLILEVYKNTNVPKDYWKKLFKGYWCEPEDFFGYVLIENKKIIGFLGTVFSYRTINNKLRKFCNLSTWVVSEEYRSYSIGLLFKILKLKNTIFTVFTPTPIAGKIYKGLGFKEIESKLIIIPPVLSIGSLFNKCKIEFSKTIIKKYLDNKEKIIFNDHLGFKCIYLLLKSKEGSCFIIGTRIKIKHITFARIHYISNLTVFHKYYGFVCLNVVLKFQVLGLIVEGRYLQDCKLVKYVIHRKLPHPTMYKSDFIERSEIDTLYSEFFLLDI